MTDGDHGTIGSGLALALGISNVFSLLEPELTTLNSTVAASGIMLQELTQLGRGLTTFNRGSAPIAGLARVADLQQAWTESSNYGLSKPAYSPDVQRPAARENPSLQIPLAPAERALSQAMRNSYSRLPQTQPVSWQTTATTRQTEASRAIEMIPARAPGIVPAATVPGSVEPPPGQPIPVVAVSVAHHASEAARLHPVELESPLPHAVSPQTEHATTPLARNHGTVLDAMVRSGFTPVATIPAIHSTAPSDRENPASQLYATAPDGDNPEAQEILSPDSPARGTITPSYRITDTVTEPMEPLQSAAANERAQTQSEPRQGVIVLDGTQLGRWIMDQLERSASRPGAMTTGIDPRMSATFPGAPTGG